VVWFAIAAGVVVLALVPILVASRSRLNRKLGRKEVSVENAERYAHEIEVQLGRRTDPVPGDDEYLERLRRAEKDHR